MKLPKVKKMNRYEKMAMRQTQLERVTKGTGRFIYRNNTSGDLTLPKSGLNGEKTVKKGETFEGDSYFNFMLVNKELRLVEDLSEKKEKKMMEEILIVDQPNRVTTKGKMETVVSTPSKKKPITEAKPEEESLINEDPVDSNGVDIIVE